MKKQQYKWLPKQKLERETKMSQIRDVIKVYNVIETQLKAAKGQPLTVNDFLLNPDLKGEERYRILDCLKQLHNKKLVYKVPVHNLHNKKEKVGYIWKESATPETSVIEPAKIEVPKTQKEKQVPEDLRIKINDDKSITIITEKIRITIEVPV